MSIINEDFMLYGESAKKLFYDHAAKMPIIDYHCHLEAKDIYENKKFGNITELLLGGDHYKWRLMRWVGIEEEYITGRRTDYEKFMMWAKTVPYLIGNPLYHWTHLELKRYFDIDIPLSAQTAKKVWDICNDKLKDDNFTPRAIIENSGVEVLCTTDGPFDSLEYHKSLNKEWGSVKVLPAFRPDKFLQISAPDYFDTLSKENITSYDQLICALSERINYFHSCGCRLSDHGFTRLPHAPSKDAERIFLKAYNNTPLTQGEICAFESALLIHCAKQYAKHNWVMQLHLNANRDNNTAMYKKIGANTGYDAIEDNNLASALSGILNTLEKEDLLPKTIVYSLNDNDNYVIAAMIGCFQRAPHFGKLQLGSGWWYMDQRDGIEKQLRNLASIGVLSTFIGMLTDSRSFVSYTRHEYFRRILCSLLGEWIDKGEYPRDGDIGEIIERIAYKNAKEYFAFDKEEK